MRRLMVFLMVSVLTTAANCVSAQGRLPPCPGAYPTAAWTECIGTIKFPNGGTYVGDFWAGQVNGRGSFTFADGSKYVGEIWNGKRNGQGIQYRADGSIERSGIWENGVLVRSQ